MLYIEYQFLSNYERSEARAMPQFGFEHGIPANSYNPHAWIIGEPEIGEQVWIGAFTVIDGSGGLTVGSGSHISSGVQIYTHSSVSKCLSAGELPIVRNPTVIGKNVHIGANAVVLMGAAIGDGSIIGAGAVVLENFKAPPGSVIVGVPGRIIDKK